MVTRPKKSLRASSRLSAVSDHSFTVHFWFIFLVRVRNRAVSWILTFSETLDFTSASEVL